jgi:CBS domain-containing protein
MARLREHAWRALVTFLVTALVFGILVTGTLLTADETTVERSESVVTGPDAQDQSSTKRIVSTAYDVTPELVFVSLVPLIVGLVVWGRLTKLTTPGFSAEFRENKRKPVTSEMVQKRDREDDLVGSILVESEYVETRAEADRRDAIAELRRDVERAQSEHRPRFLSLQTLPDEDYDYEVLWTFLTQFTDLRYVYFRDSDGYFKGLMRVSDFWTALAAYTHPPRDDAGEPYPEYPWDLSELINDGEITEHNLVVTRDVSPSVTNERALQKMDRYDLEVIAVVEDGEFVGALSRQRLLSALLSIDGTENRETTPEERDRP